MKEREKTLQVVFGVAILALIALFGVLYRYIPAFRGTIFAGTYLFLIILLIYGGNIYMLRRGIRDASLFLRIINIGLAAAVILGSLWAVLGI